MKLKQFLLLIFVSCNFLLFAQQKDTLSYENTHKFLKEKKYSIALAKSLLLKEQYKKSNDTVMLYRTFRLIGHCYKYKLNAPKAIGYYKKALRGFYKNHDSLWIVAVGNNLGRVYYTEKKIDSAIYSIKQSLKFNKTFIDSSSVISSHTNLTGLYAATKKYDLAIKHGDSALALLKITPNFKIGNRILLNNNIGNIYYKQKNYQKAKEAYLKGYVLFDNNTKQRTKSSIVQNLAAVYMLLGEKAKAKDFVKQALTLNDSLQRQIYNTKITEIEAKYSVAKEKQITKVERQKKRQLQLWLLAIILLLLGLTSVIWFYYRENKTKKEKLALRLVNQQLEQYQKIKQLHIQNQNRVLSAVSVGKETERIAIAQVLHDSVGALLSSANMHLQVVKKKSNQNIEEIKKTQTIIEEAAAKVRNLSHQLISEVLLKFGLVKAIESLCTKYSNDALVFELVTDSKIPRFEQIFEIKMHSIIEELLNNAIKHSNATEVLVTLYYDYKMLTVTVEDNGDGLNLSVVNQFESVGLAQIKARVESVGGVFIIASEKNKFSKFHIKIPVES